MYKNRGGWISGFSLICALGMYNADAKAFCGHYLGTAEGGITNSISHIVYVREGNHLPLPWPTTIKEGLPSFAMLIPVPGQQGAVPKQVNIDLVSRVDKYAGPRLVEYSCEDFNGSSRSVGCGCGETIIDYFSGMLRDTFAGILDRMDVAIGEYEIIDVPSESRQALRKWIADEGFVLPAAAGDLIESQIILVAQTFLL